MAHIGFSTYVRAADEAEAVQEAVLVLEAERGVEFHEVPLWIEDQHDGTWEVVLRKRVSPKADRPVTGSFNERTGLPFAGIPDHGDNATAETVFAWFREMRDAR